MVIVTVFRNRLRPGVDEAYGPLADEMTAIAESMPGFIDMGSYAGEDGERVAVIRFADRESHRAWAQHPDHVAAQRRGREEFYSWFDISVAEQTYARVFPRVDGVGAP